MNPTYSKSGYDITPISDDRRVELAARLSPEAFRITQKQGTERPSCGALHDSEKDAIYACVVCGLPLFSSRHKFDSGTGWPSFFAAVDEEHLRRSIDRSRGMARTEISCARCDAHLGHVFPDGPKPTGERHCLNSAALELLEEDRAVPEASRPVETETAYFAGGCFWGIQHWLKRGDGVLDARSGYMNGRTEDPTYEEVCRGDTGHAEAVEVVFDSRRISYQTLLEAFFRLHDPTQLDRQGPDIGDQYRSAIFTVGDEQARQGQAYIDRLTTEGAFARPIVTRVEPAKTFYPAEDGHQDFVERTGRGCHVANPWTHEPAVGTMTPGAFRPTVGS
jgi:peptide methionine sulfoxide reductase msrA/msrB